MSDWYARKLAELQGQPAAPAAPAAPVQAPQYPPTAPPGPAPLPPHLAPYAPPPVQPPYQGQPQPGYGAQGPAGTPQQPPAQPPGQQFYSYDANTGAQVADDGHVALLYNSAAQTGGSQLVKANTSQCPNCGGRLFAKTVSENGMPLRTPAMAQCGDCNWPVVQAGSHGGALSSTKGSGSARPARQLPANHQVTVMDGNQAVTFQPPTGAR